jgi:hypothetical protein
MNLWRRLLIAIGAPLALAFLLALVSAPPALTQGTPNRPPTPVEVVNTPLPVTGNLNAAVVGPVAAQQSGPWNVGITGTPNVNVANTVRTVNDPPQPVEASVDVTIPGGEFTGTAPAFTVPAGKRFVFEDVSGIAFLPTGQKLTQASVAMPNGPGTPPLLSFSPTFDGPSGSLEVFSFGRAAHGYAAGDVFVFTRRNSTAGEGEVFITIAGHLVDL